MKITNLTIKNYKSFGHNGNNSGNEIRSISRINMIFGYNNSGKSNLLKFIHLLFLPKINRDTLIVEGQRIDADEEIAFWKGPILNSPFIFHRNNRDRPIQFEIIIKVKHDEIEKYGFAQFKQLKKLLSKTHDYATFKIKGEIRKFDDFDTSEMLLINLKLNNKDIFSLNTTGRPIYFESDTNNNGLKDDATAFANLVSMFSNAALFLDNNRYMRNEKLSSQSIYELKSQDFKNWLYQLYLDPKRYKLFEELNAFIRKYKIATDENNPDDLAFSVAEKNSPISNFNPEFAVINGDHIELMLKRGKERLPLSSFGTGIQQLLFILTTLFLTESKIVLIEELELNLSPRYQRELLRILWALIEEGKIHQVFFTTHSSYFDHRADFSVYEVSINNLGISAVTKSNRRSKNVFFKRLDS